VFLFFFFWGKCVCKREIGLALKGRARSFILVGASRIRTNIPPHKKDACRNHEGKDCETVPRSIRGSPQTLSLSVPNRNSNSSSKDDPGTPSLKETNWIEGRRERGAQGFIFGPWELRGAFQRVYGRRRRFRVFEGRRELKEGTAWARRP